MINRTPALLLAALLSLGAPVAASAAPATASPQVEQIRPDPQAPQVGSGPHRYQFVLRDTVSAAPAAVRPFALSHTAFDLPFVAAEKDVYQGITDAQGRTPVFAFEQAPPAQGWVLLERFGSGPNGERMRLQAGDGEGIGAMAYELVVCGKTPRLYRGVTTADGDTAYVATSAIVNLLLFIDADSTAAGGDRSAGRIEADDGQTALRRCRPDAADPA
ncbi:hypothetical protein SOM22_13155 [Stenotrophomonas rhizophila]|uniref:hypothetical protein n=1 Tax=Stenotrophomonas rhizophila TaxID=216778 RepID=UPI002A699D25|nr:hypothetical protein [Stenotrophomonas rhizophila]MDY0955519.1 hypothetical protein [Stenotrophomonas rhizophila]